MLYLFYNGLIANMAAEKLRLSLSELWPQPGKLISERMLLKLRRQFLIIKQLLQIMNNIKQLFSL